MQVKEDLRYQKVSTERLEQEGRGGCGEAGSAKPRKNK